MNPNRNPYVQTYEEYLRDQRRGRAGIIADREDRRAMNTPFRALLPPAPGGWTWASTETTANPFQFNPYYTVRVSGTGATVEKEDEEKILRFMAQRQEIEARMRRAKPEPKPKEPRKIDRELEDAKANGSLLALIADETTKQQLANA